MQSWRTIVLAVSSILVTGTVEGCGNCGDSKGPIPKPCGPRTANEPFFKEREAEGIYPHGVASLNGEPTYIVGIKHHFERSK